MWHIKFISYVHVTQKVVQNTNMILASSMQFHTAPDQMS